MQIKLFQGLKLIEWDKIMPLIKLKQEGLNLQYSIFWDCEWCWWWESFKVFKHKTDTKQHLIIYRYRNVTTITPRTSSKILIMFWLFATQQR